MKTKYHLTSGGRVALSALCEGHIETTRYIQTKNNLKRVGLDTADERRLLDQRGIL
jgi:hypothetical protein